MEPDSTETAGRAKTRGAGRLVGIDIVRGLAVLGMFAGHVGDWGSRDSNGDGWWLLFVADGRPSATFALLVGVSIALMLTGRSGSAPLVGAPPANPPHTRLRVVVRAGLVIALGYALIALHTPVAVILVSFGTMFALATIALRWPTRVLLALAALFAIGGPFLLRWLRPKISNTELYDFPVVESLWSFYYPGIVWMAYILVGLVVGRLALSEKATRARLALYGGALAIAGYVIAPLLGGTSPLPNSTAGTHWWLSAVPHSRGPFSAYAPPEVLGNIGWTLLWLAVFLALAKRFRQAFAPIAAIGSMALTIYVAHILVIWAIDRMSSRPGGHLLVYEPNNISLVAFWIVGLSFAWVWKRNLGAGPLEKLMTAVSTWIADALVGKRYSRRS